MSAAPGGSRVTVVVVALTATSLVTGLVLLAIGRDVFAPPSSGADSYSRSAVGHRAFVEVLEGLGVPVVVSRHRTSARAGAGTLLVVLEPGEGEPRASEDAERLEDLVDHGGPTLVVLPKRSWSPDPRHPEWVGSAGETSTARAREVLARLGVAAAVDLAAPPAAWTTNRLGAGPEFPGGVQTIPAVDGLEPWVAAGGRVLVGRVAAPGARAAPLWVVADPDPFETHALYRGENALLVARLVDAARPPGGVVVLDETVHGHGRRPSLWAALLRWPLVLPVASAFAACLLWVAAGSVRFGAPRAAGPGVQPGSRFLVENAADLLRLGGHTAQALERYLATTVQEVAQATHAPAHLSAPEVRDWIARAGEGRRVATRLEDLERRVASAGASGDRRRVLEAAVGIHGWREEMTHGPRGDS